MDKQDTNHVNMIRTVTDYCTDNAAATNPIPAFAPLLSDSVAKLLLIDQLDQIASGTTTGVTIDTKFLRANMTLIAVKCANAVKAFALANNNNTLFAEVDFSEGDLNRLKKDEVDDISQTIHDAANANIGNVQNYGASGGDVANLQTAINLYRNATPNTRQKRISINDAKAQIKTLIKTIINDNFKAQMDNMALTLRQSNPSFVNQYFLNREVLDIGTTHTKLRGTVSNTDESPLPLADITLILSSSQVIAYQTKSREDGKYSIVPVKPNLNYDLKIAKAGFINYFEADIHFSPGEEVNRDITLQQAP